MSRETCPHISFAGSNASGRCRPEALAALPLSLKNPWSSPKRDMLAPALLFLTLLWSPENHAYKHRRLRQGFADCRAGTRGSNGQCTLQPAAVQAMKQRPRLIWAMSDYRRVCAESGPPHPPTPRRWRTTGSTTAMCGRPWIGRRRSSEPSPQSPGGRPTWRDSCLPRCR